MRYLSVCSGIEAASVAWHPLGWTPVAFSEIEKFPSAVLARHYPDVPNLGDMTEMDIEPLGNIDILVGGTPCQAFSVAGLRQSLGDARGNLTLSYVRLIHELVEHHKLRNAVWENVPGVLSTKDNAFGCFLGAIVGSDEPLAALGGKRWPNAGLVSGPKGRAAWRILDAQYFGLAQRRRRVFVVSDFGSGADPAAVLFEREGVLGNPAPSREAGASVAPTLSARTKGGGGLGTDFETDGGLIPEKWPAEIASTLNAHYGDKWGLEDQHALGGAALFVPAISNALTNNNGQRNEVADMINGLIAWAVAVRRLTPTECERLQGFPDNYTKISDKTADGPRYKALGNSMAVPVMHWIGERIDRFMPCAAAPTPRFNFGRLI